MAARRSGTWRGRTLTRSAGEILRVAGNPSTLRERAMYVTNVLLPGGTEIKTRGDTRPRWSTEHIGFDQPTIEEVRAAAEAAEGIFRVWMREQPGGFRGELPLTASARAAQAAWDPANNVVRQCIAPNQHGPLRLIRCGQSARAQ